MIIGLFLSSHLHDSGTSMFICLLIWVTLLFIIPSLANYSARSFVKVGSVENLNYDIAAIEHEFEENLSGYAQKLQKPDWGMTNTYWSDVDGFKLIGGATKSFMEIEKKNTEYSEPLRIQYADRKWQIRKVYLDKLEKQQKLARYFSFLSPAEIFKESVAGLCATNYEGHNDFLEQIRAYRETLVDYYVQNKLFSSYLYFNRQDPDSYMTADEMIRFKTNGLCKSLVEFETKYQGDWKYLKVEIPNSNLWQWQPLDLSALPSFDYKPASVMADVRDSLSYFGILLVLAIVLYYLSFLSFTKYDVR
jgi:ABC-type transport system involved in multi-copper enzyme maturation permease subunit